MIPNRISIVSYNLWNTELWPDREPALRQFLSTFMPDILCIQELRNETMICVSECLETHEKIKDDLPGWACESNIFWNKHYFKEVTHGLEDLEMPEKYRGFFWVRLKVIGSDKTILVATAHFTWQGVPKEIETGLNPRNHQIRQTIKCLKKLVKTNEPAFFMGDLNDPILPLYFLPKEGYNSCFQDLNLLSPTTYPALPMTDFLRHNLGHNETIDYIFCNGKAKTISAFVPQFYFKGLAPSDHWPVYAIYQL